MSDDPSFEPSLYGLWPRAPRYDGGKTVTHADAPGFYMIEPKARRRDPQEELRLLLNDLTAEMRAQFGFFRSLRRAAQKETGAGGEAVREARGDVKSATDAIALIIRTLEKADEMQRRLASERQAEDERINDKQDYEHAKAKFLELIEQRAEELAGRRIAEWQREQQAG
ncbi:hypothetical protein [Martelella sp. HB161492]|uniref:hypothetical protein n=1 Tax=Martelella sp. HB161492 TaxID=2720726 RepID=UPI001591F661|nr:hypothetical protein [Martelella sp. HB161492]